MVATNQEVVREIVHFIRNQEYVTYDDATAQNSKGWRVRQEAANYDRFVTTRLRDAELRRAWKAAAGIVSRQETAR